MKRNLVCHCQVGTSDKIYLHCIRTNANSTYTVVGKWGRRGQKNLQTQVKGTYPTEADAVAEQTKLHRERIRLKDYVDIESPNYDGPLTMADVAEHFEDDEEEAKRTLDIPAGQRWAITAPGKRRRYVNGPASIKLKPEEEASKGHCECGSDIFESTTDCNGKRMYRCKGCGKIWGQNGKSVKNDDYDEDAVICIDNTGMEDKFDEGIEYISEEHSGEGLIYVYDRFGKKQECFEDRFKKQSPFKHLNPGDAVKAFMSSDWAGPEMSGLTNELRMM